MSYAAFMEGASEIFGDWPTNVFWDMEDGSFLKLKPRQLYEKVEAALRKQGYRGIDDEGRIQAFVDEEIYNEIFGPRKEEEPYSATEIVHNFWVFGVPQGDREPGEARFKSMFEKVLIHAVRNRCAARYDRSNMLVLSNKINGEDESCEYCNILKDSQSRTFNVGAGHPVVILGSPDPDST